MHKHKRNTALLLILLLAAGSASAVDFTVLGSGGNLLFARDRAAGATDFPVNGFFYAGRISASQAVNDQLGLQLSFVRDPILQNIATTELIYRADFFTIGVGPFFGMFNSRAALIQTGIQSSVRLDLGGFAYVSFASANSIGGRLVDTGDYIQEASEARLGFYTPNALPSLFLTGERYTEQSDSGEVSRARTRYGLQVDLFQKNTPYTIVMTLGYQDLTNTYPGSPRITHRLNSLMVGIRLNLSLIPGFTYILDLDSSLYSFGGEQLAGLTIAESYLFRLQTGIRFSAGN